MVKNILELNNTEARSFFLKSENYCNFELPEYINFQNLLDSLSCLTELKVNEWKPWDNKEGINYILFNNKDGEYSWRKLELINPILYVEIVNKITEEKNWSLLKSRFENFDSDKKINCVSLPQVSKSKSVSSWKESFEKESIRLSLDYDYISHTDIVDCYGSIYTHSIAWAVHTKPEAKKILNRKNYDLLGVFLDQRIAAMNSQQTNGIPQGSVLMDFIAEIVLGYIDTELSNKIREDNSKIKGYKILRFRDDYRIFTKDLNDGKIILKLLSEVLSSIGMRLNATKTTSSSEVSLSSIKKDRLNWLLFKNKNIDFAFSDQNTIKFSKSSLLDEVILIQYFLNNNRNAGSIISVFKSIYDKIKNQDRVPDAHAIIAVIANILEKNPRLYYPGFSIISSLLLKITSTERKKIVKKIHYKFKNQPNSEYLDLWIQNISIDLKLKTDHKQGLCAHVQSALNTVWNIDGVDKEIKNIFSEKLIIDEKILIKSKKKPLIKFSGLRRNRYEQN